MSRLPQDASLSLSIVEDAFEYRAPSPIAVEVVGLFAELRNPLLRYVLALGLPMPDGEEIVQEVFLALFVHLRKGKPRTNLRGWVFRVGHNLALKRRMRDGRAARLLTETAPAIEPVDPAPTPEEDAVDAAERKHLLRVLDTLTEQDRCCLHLRAEGLRYREIAATLGISLGGVALSLARSLAKLRDGRNGKR